MANGYKSMIKHGHPNAYSSGRIYEHVFVMSEKLGRPLTAFEVVHHIDEDKRNNHPDNLQLFATAKEHNQHHADLRALIIRPVAKTSRNTPEGRAHNSALSKASLARKRAALALKG